MRCISCGFSDRKYLIKHHVSYNPEKVVILCYYCHRVAHGRVKKGEVVDQNEALTILKSIEDLKEVLRDFGFERASLEKQVERKKRELVTLRGLVTSFRMRHLREVESELQERFKKQRAWKRRQLYQKAMINWYRSGGSFWR